MMEKRSVVVFLVCHVRVIEQDASPIYVFIHTYLDVRSSEEAGGEGASRLQVEGLISVVTGRLNDA